MISFFKNKLKVDEPTKEPVAIKAIAISTTELSYLAGIHLPAKLVKSFGIQPLAESKNGVLWPVESVPEIFLALSKHFRQKATEELNK